MDSRKLMEFGKSSYIISLPKNWIRSNKLKKGDSLHLKESAGDIILSLSNEEKELPQKKIIIDTKDKSIGWIKAEVVGSYLNCYDLIEIRFNGLETRLPQIKEIIRNLSGLEIMEQTSSKMAAKDILNPKEVDINSIIRRMDVILRSMIDDGISCFSETNREKMETLEINIRQRDEDINRLYFLSHRVIKNALKNPSFGRALGMDPWQLYSSALIILRLEKIGDRQKRIATLCLNSKQSKKWKNDVSLIYQDMRDKYLDVMKSYYTNNLAIAFEVETSNKNRINNCNELLKKSDSADSARIIENLSAMTTSIKYISRDVIGTQD
ncbi:PhoU domain-containing protein [Nanoarchaeota archaeon]